MERTKLKMHKYTQQEIDWLKENSIGVPFRDIAKNFNAMFGASVNHKSLEQKIHKIGISNGLKGGQFPKGHVPFNKGKKKYWIGGEETQFKKGHIPFNYRPVGSERINRDGYIEVKVADPHKWELKHRVLYKKHFGEIPRGFIVIFADGNKKNLNIENLSLISRKQSAIINHKKLNYFDKTSLDVCKNIADISHEIHKKRKVKKYD